jgi:hypothetical protein
LVDIELLLDLKSTASVGMTRIAIPSFHSTVSTGRVKKRRSKGKR